MRPLRPNGALTALLLALALTAPAVGASDGQPEDPWVGERPLTAGTARYDQGEWIYTDFVYDDYGADTGPAWGQPNVVSLGPTAGDARYPAGLENSADIVEVRARAAGNDLQMRVVLQTLTDPSLVALWVEVNGEERVVTADDADIDPAVNTVTFTLSDAAVGETVAITVGAGLHDGAGGLRAGVPGIQPLRPGEITTGGPTDNRLLDLAFNTHEIEGRGGAWNEDRQSAALASGDLEAFTQHIDLDALRDDSVRPLEPLAPGYHVRLFESRMDLGEGIGSSFPQFRGRWQPDALWVPESYDPDEPAPLFLDLHSLSVHHNQYRGGRSPTYATYYEQMGDELGAVVVTPLGRGPDGWYLNEAFVDALEVWADGLDTFSIDPEQVLVGGYSMGGYGTYRLTTLMPDAFAAAVSVVGPPRTGSGPGWTARRRRRSPGRSWRTPDTSRSGSPRACSTSSCRCTG